MGIPALPSSPRNDKKTFSVPSVSMKVYGAISVSANGVVKTNSFITGVGVVNNAGSPVKMEPTPDASTTLTINSPD